MREFNYHKTLNATEAFDVIVVGSGPAGLAAAVSSTRQGARTALLERYGSLGGNITSGHVGPLMGRVSDGTIVDEVHKVLNTRFGGPQHDVEKSRIFFTNWTRDAGVEVFLQAPAADVIVEDGTIQGLVIGTKSGLEVFQGNIIIDATGDGTVSYLAGAECLVGRDGDGLLQPVSLMYTVAGVDTANALYCGGEQSNVMFNGEKYVDFCHKKHAEGELPENVAIVRLYPSVNPGEVMVNATQANYINGLEYNDIAKAEVILRNQMESVTEFLRKYVPGYANCYIKDSAETLGIRETRRVKGDYVLQDADLLKGARFPDVMVHKARFVIDIHNPTGGGQAEGLAKAVEPYDIPYGCFLPVGLNNLLTAGRCISGTHRAHASYRVMNICMAMGQAAGTAAALAVKQGVIPRKLDYKLIQDSLAKQGVNLFD